MPRISLNIKLRGSALCGKPYTSTPRFFAIILRSLDVRTSVDPPIAIRAYETTATQGDSRYENVCVRNAEC